MTKRNESFLRWAGSKRQLIPYLSKYWGNGYNTYIEPFMGSASLFFAINPAKAVLSDTNTELIKTFKILRRNPVSLYELVNKYPKTENYYYKLRNIDPNKLNSLEIAARFYFLNRLCFNGLYRTNLNGKFNVPYGGAKAGHFPNIIKLKVLSKSLRRADIICEDFEETINRYVNKSDFVFLDPPYSVKNNKIFVQYGPSTFGMNDLRRLKNCISIIIKRKAFFVLTYSACPEIMEIFGKWYVDQVKTKRNISGFIDKRKIVCEYIFSNIEA